MDDLPEAKNSLWRREDQLRRWDLSETNKLSSQPKHADKVKVKFQDGCVFLAACAAEDTDEITRLIQRGADINTANVDGLTALHQACIDDTIDIIKYLVDHGADINACDNEGWTALHVAASCGTPTTAKYLIDKGADIAAVNNDGELALDLAEGAEMDQLIKEEMKTKNIDANAARNEEHEVMLRDAQTWLRDGYTETPHPKTQATALHVAAAKGYTDVISILLQAGANIEMKDVDGWTPIFGAAHWGQEAAATALVVEGFCNLEARNNAGQTAFDICEQNLLGTLKDLRRKQSQLHAERERNRQSEEKTINRHGQIKRRSSVTRMSLDKKRDVGHTSVLDERDKVLEALSNNSLIETKEGEHEPIHSDSDATEEEDEDEDEDEEKENEAPSTDTPMEAPSSPPPPVPVSPPDSSISTTGTKSPDQSLKLGLAEGPESMELISPDTPASKKQEVKDISKPAVTKPEDVELSITTKPPQKKEDAEDQKSTEEVPIEEDKEEEEESSDEEEETSSGEEEETSSEEEETETEKQNEINKKKSESAGVTPTSPSLRGGSISPPIFKPPAHILEEEERAEREKQRLLDMNARRREAEAKLLVEEAKEAARQEEIRRKMVQEEYERLSKRSSTGSGFRLLSDEPKSKEARKTGDYENPRQYSTSSTLGDSSTAADRNRTHVFEPPKRDEEKEVERKARAKRARETRRSTQGVTKEDLARAEESLKQADDKNKENRPTTPDDAPLIIRDNTDTAKKDQDDRKARDSGISTENNNASLGHRAYRRPVTTLGSGSSTTDSASTTTSGSGSSTTPLQSSLRSSLTSSNTRSNTLADPTDTAASLDKLLGSKSQGTPVIQVHHDTDTSSVSSKDEADTALGQCQKSAAIKARRKRENRKLTGKVTIEDLQKAQEEVDEKTQQATTTLTTPTTPSATTTTTTTTPADTTTNYQTSSRYGTSSSSSRLSEPSGDYSRSSYLSRSAERPASYTPTSSSYNRSNTNLSTSSVGSSAAAAADKADGGVDYKRLYEQEKAASEKLRKDVERISQDLKETKLELERARLKNETKVHDTRTDLRERRAQERKISELEEEIKSIANLKADNQRLKEENGALIRVISKLSK